MPARWSASSRLLAGLILMGMGFSLLVLADAPVDPEIQHSIEVVSTTDDPKSETHNESVADKTSPKTRKIQRPANDSSDVEEMSLEDLRKQAHGWRTLEKSSLELRDNEMGELESLIEQEQAGGLDQYDARQRRHLALLVQQRQEQAALARALAESLEREIRYREQIQRLDPHADEIKIVRLTTDAENEETERRIRKHQFDLIEDFRDRLQLLEEKSKALRTDGKFEAAKTG